MFGGPCQLPRDSTPEQRPEGIPPSTSRYPLPMAAAEHEQGTHAATLKEAGGLARLASGVRRAPRLRIELPPQSAGGVCIACSSLGAPCPHKRTRKIDTT